MGILPIFYTPFKVHAYNGCEHTLVVLEDGQVVSFGYNYRGQLGQGNTTSEPVPKAVRGLDGTKVAKVSCSYYHSIISSENGQVTPSQRYTEYATPSKRWRCKADQS